MLFGGRTSLQTPGAINAGSGAVMPPREALADESGEPKPKRLRAPLHGAAYETAEMAMIAAAMLAAIGRGVPRVLNITLLLSGLWFIDDSKTHKSPLRVANGKLRGLRVNDLN